VPQALDARIAPLRDGPAYEVLALRYGTCVTRRSLCFLDYGTRGEADGPQRLDFYLWVLRGDGRTVVVDTGFDRVAAAYRGRTCLIDPVQALQLAGVDAESVELLVLTHLHYDHIGNVSRFPRASLLVHSREIEHQLEGPREHDPLVEAGELEVIEQARSAGRVIEASKDGEVAPGVLALWTGGHTPGQMIIVVRGGDRPIVLASDALHLHEEFEQGRLFTPLSDAVELRAAHELLRELARRGARIVPGHDAAVMERGTPLASELRGVGMRVS
jgi:glyoxylase-like metal-dependent hydrolase (beta-lactamase superfamily II)